MVDPSKPDHSAMPHRRPPFTRKQVIAQVAVAGVILISGMVIGSGGTVLALKDRIIPRLRLLPPDPDPGPGPEPNWLVDRWRGEYSLSDKQARQVRDTLTKQWAATRELWEKFNQAQQTERERFAESMKKILTPEQFTKWDSDLKKRFEHFRGMRPFDGRGGGRGGPRGDRRDGPPDQRMNPDEWRGGRPPGPPRDPNGLRGEGMRGRRREWGPRDPNGRRMGAPTERSIDPNNHPEISPPPGEIPAS